MVDPPDWSDRAGSPASAVWGTGQVFPTSSHKDSRQGGRESFQQPLSAKKRVRVGEACCVNGCRRMPSSLVIATGNKKRLDRSLLVVHSDLSRINQSILSTLCTSLAVSGEGLTAMQETTNDGDTTNNPSLVQDLATSWTSALFLTPSPLPFPVANLEPSGVSSGSCIKARIIFLVRRWQPASGGGRYSHRHCEPS
jgi:hypothetical protein